MEVSVYSRLEIESLIEDLYLDDIAVISFYNPGDQPVDYKEYNDNVLFVPLDDFQTELPQAYDIAEFVHNARKNGSDIICQCEMGRNRSAGCAAAIMKYYNKNGQEIFDDDRYRPDKKVYYEVLKALEEYAPEECIK